MKQPFNLTKEQLLNNLTEMFEKPINVLAVGVGSRNYLVSTSVETPIKDMIYSDSVKRIFLQVEGDDSEHTITSEDLVVVVNPKQRTKVDLEQLMFNSLSGSTKGTLDSLRFNISKNNIFVSHAQNFLGEVLGLKTSALKYDVSKYVPLESGQNYYGLIVENNDFRKNIKLVLTYHMMALVVGERYVILHDDKHDVDFEDLARFLNSWFGLGERELDVLFGEGVE